MGQEIHARCDRQKGRGRARHAGPNRRLRALLLVRQTLREWAYSFCDMRRGSPEILAILIFGFQPSPQPYPCSSNVAVPLTPALSSRGGEGGGWVHGLDR